MVPLADCQIDNLLDALSAGPYDSVLILSCKLKPQGLCCSCCAQWTTNVQSDPQSDGDGFG